MKKWLNYEIGIISDVLGEFGFAVRLEAEAGIETISSESDLG